MQQMALLAGRRGGLVRQAGVPHSHIGLAGVVDAADEQEEGRAVQRGEQRLLAVLQHQTPDLVQAGISRALLHALLPFPIPWLLRIFSFLFLFFWFRLSVVLLAVGPAALVFAAFAICKGRQR